MFCSQKFELVLPLNQILPYTVTFGTQVFLVFGARQDAQQLSSPSGKRRFSSKFHQKVLQKKNITFFLLVVSPMQDALCWDKLGAFIGFGYLNRSLLINLSTIALKQLSPSWSSAFLMEDWFSEETARTIRRLSHLFSFCLRPCFELFRTAHSTQVFD